MKDDPTTLARRALLGAVGALGLSAATGCFGADHAPTPATASASGTAAPGAQAVKPMKPSTYRLQPLTGYGPSGRQFAPPKVRSEPIQRMSGQRRAMVLTFDDGPDPRYTPAVLRILRRYDVRAMFFVCGKQVADHGHLLRKVADDGNVIGNHTWSHPLLTAMSQPAIRSEIRRTSEIIADTLGEPPLWFRAPYGAWNRTVFQIGAALGMEPLAWTVDTEDWQTPGAAAITRAVLTGAGTGVVVLSHDAGGNRSQTVEALRTWLPKLLEKGYHMTLPRRRFA